MRTATKKKNEVMILQQEPTPLPRIGYDADEAAQILGVSRTHLYKLMKCGDVTGADFGGVRRFTLAELEVYAATQTQAAKAAKAEAMATC